jgi:hypothetical protein
MYCYFVPPACSSREGQLSPPHELRRICIGLHSMVPVRIIKAHTICMPGHTGQLCASLLVDVGGSPARVIASAIRLDLTLTPRGVLPVNYPLRAGLRTLAGVAGR